ncbi:uncharacterized protein LOC133795126 [Humulus lupulus]|uniref:uncharacterized protein LOC133795126 n=1 Tax=Humulus lupulus TaxID=3486 RepID=UPI002B402D71|nr:uncharacterized protein LOC133795126 [Humulus lupulus]
MYFSPNTPENLKDFYVSIFKMPITHSIEKYLGLPMLSGRNKSRLFADIKEKVWLKLNSWNSKLFSYGGREILLKDVIQAMPTYVWDTKVLADSHICTSTRLWEYPLLNQYKLNVDASIDEVSNSIGIGAILQNSNGDGVACLSKPLFGLSVHVVETDCLAAVSAFAKRETFFNDFGSLLEDITSLLYRFSGVSLIHVRRSANMAAHE